MRINTDIAIGLHLRAAGNLSQVEIFYTILQLSEHRFC